MCNDPLELQVARRRGCWDSGGNNWEAILFAGGMDAVGSRLGGMDEIGLVKRDVTEPVLARRCAAPDGRWALLIKLAGTNWVHLADPTVLNPFQRDGFQAEHLAKASGLRLLQTGYQKTADATYVVVYEGEKEELYFESTGAGFGDDSMANEGLEEEEFDSCEITVLRSKIYAEDWWKQFAHEEEVQQALLQDLCAYVPFLYAHSEDGRIAVAAGHEDVVTPEHIERIDLVVFGASTSAEPNPGGHRLSDAISAGDLAGVEAALEAGADLYSLPGVMCSPLIWAIRQMKAAHADGPRIVAILLDAGADPNGEVNTDTPLIEAIGQVKRNFQPAFEVIKKLLDAGADINRPGKRSYSGCDTPLSKAVDEGVLAVVMLLHQRGVDMNQTGLSGKMILTTAEERLKWLQENWNVGGETIAQTVRSLQSIVDYLRQTASGAAPGDWKTQAKRDCVVFESEQRRLQVEREEFARQMKESESKHDEV